MTSPIRISCGKVSPGEKRSSWVKAASALFKWLPPGGRSMREKGKRPLWTGVVLQLTRKFAAMKKTIPRTRFVGNGVLGAGGSVARAGARRWVTVFEGSGQASFFVKR